MSTSYQRNKLIVITAAVTMVATSLVWIGIGGLGYFLIYSKPPAFGMTVECPETVALGTEFELKVTVTNRGTKPARLEDLDFYDQFLDGFEVVSVSPRPKNRQRLLGIVTYHFGERLEKGGKFDFIMKLRAKAPGYWAGDIDACNPFQKYVTHHTGIVVVDMEEEASRQGEGEAPEKTGE